MSRIGNKPGFCPQRTKSTRRAARKNLFEIFPFRRGYPILYSAFSGVKYRDKDRNGFSFVEVMVTIAILTTGIMMIYRSFLTCLNFMNHLSRRAYALTLLDNKIQELQHLLETRKQIPFSSTPQSEEVNVGNKNVHFDYSFAISALAPLDNIYDVDVTISWDEGGRRKYLTRHTYIAHYKPLLPPELKIPASPAAHQGGPAS